MRYFFALILLTLFGCATVNFTPSSTASFPAYTGDVAVLEKLPEKYQEVGWVSVEGAAGVPPTTLLDHVKTKARERGATAVVFNGDSMKIFAPYGRCTLFCRAIIQER